jgi:DNA-binding XRE family transcriptional regulator
MSGKATAVVPKKIGRPRCPIDLARLAKAAQSQATSAQIATSLGVCLATLKNKIADDPDVRRTWNEHRKAPAPLAVSGEQLRAARAMLRIGQTELASRANLSADTVKRLESFRGSSIRAASEAATLAVVRALEAAGIKFLPDNGLRLVAVCQICEEEVVH